MKMQTTISPHIWLDARGIAWVDDANTKVREIALDVIVVAGVTSARSQETWSAAISPTHANLWSVSYGGGQFVAVGEGGIIVSSSDGATWGRREAGAPAYWLVAVAYGAGTWVVVGDHGLILTSSDLVAWNLRASGTTARINGVA